MSETIKNHKYYKLCYKTYPIDTISCSEKNAKKHIIIYDTHLYYVLKLDGSVEIFDKLFVDWMTARHCCLWDTYGTPSWENEREKCSNFRYYINYLENKDLKWKRKLSDYCLWNLILSLRYSVFH